MRLLALLSLAFACGCSTSNQSYINAHGALADGSAFDVQLAAIATRGAPWKLQTTAGQSVAGNYIGFWLWFDPSVMQGASYPSTGSSTDAGAVHFFVLENDATAPGNATSHLVDGGTIAFTAGGPDNYAGDLSQLVLARNGATLLTVAGGSFLAETK